MRSATAKSRLNERWTGGVERQQHRQQQGRTPPIIRPARSADLSVLPTLADARKRYAGDCKTVYTGSIPVVASTF
jgi:hypothetical protein